MEETLIIKNFGPIESVELKLKRFTILIGEQATGKSTVAKVLAAIYSFLDIANYSRNSRSGLIGRLSEQNNFSRFKQHLSVYEIQNYLKLDSFIHLIGKTNFQLNNGNISSDLEQLTNTDFFSENTITYIPADRGAASLFTNATWADLIDVEDGRVNLPKYFLRFFSLYSRIKENNEFDFTKTLGIKFINKGGVDKVVLEDGKAISIYESASAIQTNLPLYIIVDWQARNKNSRKFFLIEEPELNFFPSAQHITTEYLVNAILSGENRILLTTHSPYILTSINNLIYAYQVGQEYPAEVSKIIDKKYWLNPDEVSAYRLFPDERYEDILDEELKQIDAGKIDEASRELNSIWDKISDIKFSSVGES